MPIVDIKTKEVSSNDNLSKSTSSGKKLDISFKSMPTIISRDLTIEGEIVSLGLIEIEGRIKGTIKGNSVVLRENCFVEGVIIAQSLSLRGAFDGKINAESIEISGKAKVTGEIEYQSLVVEDGACIDGNFKKRDQ